MREFTTYALLSGPFSFFAHAKGGEAMIKAPLIVLVKLLFSNKNSSSGYLHLIRGASAESTISEALDMYS